MRFILASASPARLTVLRGIGFDPEVIVSGVDESTIEEESPGRLCRALAKLKAKAVAATLTEDAYVLGCDSVLEFNGQTYGKAEDAETAVSRWKAMRGKSGVLHTGHCLIDTAKQRRHIRSSSTTVHFADVTDTEIAAYVDSGEPMRVAGAFTIDGLGAPFVERIEGDHGTVVGVSPPLLRQMFTAWGVPISSLWRTESA
ncbi:Maf family protein [Stackebrandtia nassauensis]|uniref:Nucleoside triphosphate pyrophosphatase n=1 Tax=Stackebrandtia nassauensis (strain DSM 44728 / CIP 108903 / NRRL B-16338 / NBRC 102104 / LLR-40K-21) TaxID=446470 RepID=D3Q7Z5_STANL|nr:nucleoside triphosphate pyrophosphatase [Stackebrandtia nassauensis]ADD40500.1 maf protein [Stackebrandtia nassauensis DSM 44728]